MGACSGGPAKPATAAGSGDATFTALATEILEDYYQRNPTSATDLGIHKYDDKLEDYSAAAVASEVTALKAFRARLEAIAPNTLTLDRQLDREQLIHSIDGTLLQDEVIKSWAKDADNYSSGITNTAYVMIKRTFAPPEERMAKLIARMKLMPAVLAEARKNLTASP